MINPSSSAEPHKAKGSKGSRSHFRTDHRCRFSPLPTRQGDHITPPGLPASRDALQQLCRKLQGQRGPAWFCCCGPAHWRMSPAEIPRPRSPTLFCKLQLNSSTVRAARSGAGAPGIQTLRTGQSPAFRV